jgi:glycosyltransferase involved in cell wall biosynthesis
VTLVHIATDPTSFSFLRGQVSYMQSKGFSVVAIASPGDYLRLFSDAEGVATLAVEMPRRITPLSDLHSLYRLVRAIRRINPAIVHSHTPKGGLLGMVAAWLSRVPVRVYHMRGLPMLGAAGARRQLLRITEYVACRLAHRVFCVSNSIRQLAISSGIAPEGKLLVLADGSGNGVDARQRFAPDPETQARGRELRARLGIPAEALVIGFVGRLVRDKGIAELAGAWERLREELPAARLLLLGRFEPQDPIPRAAREPLERDPRVHLAGLDWDSPPYYAAMDILALPTYREGFPNVALEAAAMALPVVATEVPGCVDAIVDGVTGTLVPARDAEALAAALRRYAEQPELRSVHGSAARQRVLESFEPDRIWRSLLSEYISLMASRETTRARAAGIAQRQEDDIRPATGHAH